MTLYLDTSSLVKLYVAEPGSEVVRGLVTEATVVATSPLSCLLGAAMCGNTRQLTATSSD